MAAAMAGQPHALMFPLPAQGHINPMMELAKKLALQEGFFVTFVNTEYNHGCIFNKRQANNTALQLGLPNLRFEQLPDGLPSWHKRYHQGPGFRGIVETTASLTALSGSFAKLLQRLSSFSATDGWPPITCIIADAFLTWVQDVADQFSIPRVALWTTPAHANLAYKSQPLLEAQGYIPFRGKVKLSETIRNIPGVADMKLRDWISFFLVEESTDFLYQYFMRLCMKRAEDAAWNLGNNVEQLEQDAVVAYRKEVPNFLPIGPLVPMDPFSGGMLGISPIERISLWPEGNGCYEWLSQHPKGSVLYISCSSVTNATENELQDLIQALEDSEAPFLWGVRVDDESGAALKDLNRRLEAEKASSKSGHSQRALLVPWTPQVNVLAHPAVGAFLSHCGWNSLLESFCAGVPILARPGGFAEQRMNAHYVTEVWKVGLPLPSAGASRADVIAVVRALLGGGSPEAKAIRSRLAQLQHSAIEAISPLIGSSYSNFRLFTNDMRKRAARSQSNKVAN